MPVSSDLSILLNKWNVYFYSGSFLSLPFYLIQAKTWHIRLITLAIATPHSSFNGTPIYHGKQFILRSFQCLRDNLVQAFPTVLPIFSTKRQLRFSMSLNKRYLSLRPVSLVHIHTVSSHSKTERTQSLLWCISHCSSDPVMYIRSALPQRNDCHRTSCTLSRKAVRHCLAPVPSFFWQLVVMFLLLAFETCPWAWLLMLILLGSPREGALPTMLLNPMDVTGACQVWPGHTQRMQRALGSAVFRMGLHILELGAPSWSCQSAEQTSSRTAIQDLLPGPVFMEDTQRVCLSSLSRQQMSALSSSTEEPSSSSLYCYCIYPSIFGFV